VRKWKPNLCAKMKVVKLGSDWTKATSYRNLEVADQEFSESELVFAPWIISGIDDLPVVASTKLVMIAMADLGICGFLRRGWVLTVQNGDLEERSRSHEECILSDRIDCRQKSDRVPVL